MSTEVLDPAIDQRRISRRTLIRGGVAAGATAWVAPMIIDSLASPAAAASMQGGCYRLFYGVSSFDSDCAPATPQTGCCEPTGYPSASPGTDLTVAMPDCVMAATGCGITDSSATFTLSATCDCVFVTGTLYTFGGVCESGTLSNGNKTIQFSDTPCTDPPFPGFRLLVACGGQTCVDGSTDTCEGCGT